MLKKVSKNSPKIYYCEKCDYYAKRKSDLNKHFKSKKHNAINAISNANKNSQYQCECGKIYKQQPSLSRHKKKCTYKKIDTSVEDSMDCSEPNIDNVNLKDMVMDLLQSNKELQDTIIQQQSQLIELAKEPKTIIKTQNNNTFNLNNFLNVDCKNAMNLSDFLDTIKYTFKDLLHLGDNGFVKSLQNTFVKELSNMDQTMRPIHCTDKKRKIMYVKDENKWEKDNGNKKIASAIKSVNRKQLESFSEHSKERPEDYLDNDSNAYTQHRIIKEMCGYTNETSDDINGKIINNMSSKLQINKVHT